MLEAVVSHDGKYLPRRALRRLKVTSIEDYAKAVATNLNGENSGFTGFVDSLNPAKSINFMFHL